jgi:hypothetical protein
MRDVQSQEKINAIGYVKGNGNKVSALCRLRVTFFGVFAP